MLKESASERNYTEILVGAELLDGHKIRCGYTNGRAEFNATALLVYKSEAVPLLGERVDALRLLNKSTFKISTVGTGRDVKGHLLSIAPPGFGEQVIELALCADADDVQHKLKTLEEKAASAVENARKAQLLLDSVGRLYTGGEAVEAQIVCMNSLNELMAGHLLQAKAAIDSMVALLREME